MGEFAKTTVLVTGATGFLARHTILVLQRQGWTVRATVRASGRAEAFVNTMTAAGADMGRLEIVQGDLLSRSNWAEAMHGVGSVLHMASAMTGRDVEAAALSGTRHVLEAAAKAGVARVVVTSSGLAAAPHGQRRVTEAAWTNPDGPGLTTYAAAKTRAERLSWTLAERLGLALTTILPGVILGPDLGPDRPAWLGLLAAMRSGRLPLLPPIGLQIVDARDLAQLHVEAMIQPQAVGQRYLAAGSVLTLRDIALIMRTEWPRDRISTREMPAWLLRLMALTNSEVQALLALRHAPELDAGKAAEELSWRTRPARESVLDAARSL